MQHGFSIYPFWSFASLYDTLSYLRCLQYTPFFRCFHQLFKIRMRGAAMLHLSFSSRIVTQSFLLACITTFIVHQQFM